MLFTSIFYNCGVPSLDEYKRKRNFKESPEPKGEVHPGSGGRFVVQEHHAKRLHYDFRLEVDGVLKSWAVPKGPSMDPAERRLAIQTEDHPLEYRTFQGQIPKGHYGAGEVKIWDDGTFEPEGTRSASEQINAGEIKFRLYGQKLDGSFVLVKLRGRDRRQNEWLLIKHRETHRETGKPVSRITRGRSHGQEERNQAEGGENRNLSLKPKRKIPMPPGAIRRPMPELIAPALATLSEKPFSDPDWIFEIKWDGARALAQIRDHKVRLIARSNRDITQEYPELRQMPASIEADEAWIDGEIVVLDKHGRSDFERLQKRFGVKSPSIELQRSSPACYYAFDLLYYNGYDLRGSPLIERKNFLREILGGGPWILYSDHQVGKGKELFELAKKNGLEGIVGKRSSSRYQSGRTADWLKFKATSDMDAVVGGWTDPRGSREYFGALLLGLYEEGKLIYIGSVGSGFSGETQKQLWSQLQSLRTSQCPFAARPDTRERAYWTRPSFVARVKFAAITQARQLRAPRFLGMVEDREPEACTFEGETGAGMREQSGSREEVANTFAAAVSPKRETVHATKGHSRAHAKQPEAQLTSEDEIEEELNHGSRENVFVELDGVRLHLTNLNKIYFPEDKYTKRNLLAYYYRVAPLIVPFLRDRPLVLRRYPNGIAEEAFFQKDSRQDAPDWLKTATIFSEDKDKPIRYFLANDCASLLYLTNLGCIDHNPWSSRYDDSEHPDYIFFDLDPTPETSFSTVIKAARSFISILQKLGLTPFSKTSGATGFHIFLPVERAYTYEQARAFVQTIALLVAKQDANLLTFERTVRKRPNGRIYIDVHQNSQGQSLASVYSVRAFPHAPVSAPVKERELTSLHNPEKWNIRSVPERIDSVGNLWEDFWNKRQRLETVLEHGKPRR